MDLWDLTRLLLRRWYFALPILLVSALTAVFVSKGVDPDYQSTGNVVLIPAPGDPSDSDPKTSTKQSRPKNPWLDLGYSALASAAILKVMDQKTLTDFGKEGLSESVTVTMAERSPIFIIEVVGNSPAQATATVREVIKVLADEVAAQQKRYGVLPPDTITTLTLTDGADVQVVTSKVKRVLIVTVGIGLILTAAGTIGLDVFLRWRRRRREAPLGAVTGVAPAASGPEPAEEDHDADANRAIRPRFVGSRRASTEETQVIGRIPSAGGDTASGRATTRSGRSSVLAGGGGRRSAVPAEPVAADDLNGNGRTAAEATIILPLPRSQWSDERNDAR